jgi:hypothetical protein
MKTIDAFRVLAVEPCNMPNGGVDGVWCRYVVANGNSRIVGRRRGPLAQARSHAERFAGDLNDRLLNGRSLWSPRSRRRSKS